MHHFEHKPLSTEEDLVKSVKARIAEHRPPTQKEVSIATGFLKHYLPSSDMAQITASWVCKSLAQSVAYPANYDPEVNGYSVENHIPEEVCIRDAMVLLRYCDPDTLKEGDAARAFETARKACLNEDSYNLKTLAGPILARAALCHYFPKAGSIRFDGSPMEETSDSARRKIWFLEDVLKVHAAMNHANKLTMMTDPDDISSHERMAMELNTKRAFRYLAEHLIEFGLFRILLKTREIQV